MAGSTTEEELLVFDVEEPQEEANGSVYWANYRRFVESLRRSYLPFDGPLASLTFDIVLRSNSHQIKLRLDRSNYFMIGYQMETPQQWLEFQDDSEIKGSWRRSSQSDYYIPGAFLLGMPFAYKKLERECRQTVESISLGQQQLASAVNILATSTCTGKDWARSLIIVSLMICEGGRFSYFSEYLAARFLDNLPTPKWMRKPLDKYDRTDGVTELRQSIIPGVEDSNRNNEDISNTIKDDIDCHHLEEDNNHMEPFENESYDGNYDDESSNLDPPISLQPLRWASKCTPQLQSLSEIFFVRVSNVEGKHSGTFYGTIYIRGSEKLESQCIYNQRREESQFVQSGDLLSLSGPRKPIKADYSFFFALALNGEGTQYVMDFSCYSNKYDRPLIDEYYGEHCSLSMFYVALERAIYATLTVTFVDEDRKGHARVYGQLSAQCGDFGYEIALFQKKAEEHIDARPGRAIKLLRNVVSVPWNSRLVLRANLFEYADTSFDQEIAKGLPVKMWNQVPSFARRFFS